MKQNKKKKEKLLDEILKDIKVLDVEILADLHDPRKLNQGLQDLIHEI